MVVLATVLLKLLAARLETSFSVEFLLEVLAVQSTFLDNFEVETKMLFCDELSNSGITSSALLIFRFLDSVALELALSSITESMFCYLCLFT